jgi:hypothetical protein
VSMRRLHDVTRRISCQLTALAAASCAVLGAPACSRPAAPAAPVATISVGVSRPAVAAGEPLDLRYRFVRVAGAPAPPADAWVFVHALDDSGTLLWTDDHEPPLAASRWGDAPVDYTRTMFVPRLPVSGRVRIQAGLFSRGDGTRLPLRGTEAGDRAYAVASFEVRTPSSEIFIVYGDGWYGAERSESDALRAWRWSAGAATLSFRNPGEGAVLTLELDQPVAQVGPQTVDVRLGSASLGVLQVAAGGARRVYRLPLPSGAGGNGSTVDVTLVIQPTFIPSALPVLASADSRELGVRLFNVHVGR